MRKIGLVVLAAALATGCGGTQLSVSAKAGPSSAALGALSSALTLNGGAVVVDDVRIVLRRIKLETVATSPGGSSPGEQEFALSPRVVHFSLQGIETPRLEQVFTASVEAKTFQEIKFEIHKVDDSDIASVTDAQVRADLQAMNGSSIIIAGTYNGTPFTFTSTLDEEQEREGTFNVADGSNITLSIDPTNWFSNGAGGTLDPSSSSNRSQIESNIKASIDAFDDDNRDGLPDHS